MKKIQNIKVSLLGVYGIIFLLLFGFTACENPDINPINYTEKLYEDGVSFSLQAIDMADTPDGGYVILGIRNSDQPYVMKLAEDGTKEWAVWDENLGKPVRSIVVTDAGYLFFVQDGTDVSLVQVNASIGDNGSRSFQKLAQITYPSLAATDVPQECVPNGPAFPTALYSTYNDQIRGFLLVGDEVYDEVSWWAFVPIDNPQDVSFRCSKYDLKSITVEDPEASRRQFFGGFYPWNGECCFYFTSFFDDGNGSQIYLQFLKNDFEPLIDDVGVVGFPGDNMSDLQGLENGGSADIRFNLAFADPQNGYGYTVSNLETSLGDFEENIQLEMDGNSRNKLLGVSPDGQKYIFAGKAHANQLVLLAYNGANLVNKTFLGSSNPYEVAQVINTKDLGIAIAATTHIGSRLERIAFFKLSKEQVDDLLKE